MPVDTLEHILDSVPNVPSIDFLSLDVEGYEIQVLEGLNLKKYRPRYMLIEVYKKDFNRLVYFLDEHEYTLINNMSGYTFETNPLWDGKHNDYLFVDSNDVLLLSAQTLPPLD